MSAAVDLGIPQLSGVEVVDPAGSTVYRAHHGGLGMAVAVKVMTPHTEPLVPRRFDIRRKSLARFAESAGVVTVLESGTTTTGRAYVMMPYYSLGSLLDRFDGAARPWKEAVALVAEVAEVVAEGHDLGVVLGDLKPSSVLLSESGRALVSLYGMATRRFDDGSPSYSAPERRPGAALTPAADVYSLCAVLVTLLAGRTHRPPETPQSLLDAIDGSLPDAVAGVIAKGLDNDPTGRFQHATEVRVALETLLVNLQDEPETDGEAVTASDPAPTSPAVGATSGSTDRAAASTPAPGAGDNELDTALESPSLGADHFDADPLDDTVDIQTLLGAAAAESFKAGLRNDTVAGAAARAETPAETSTETSTDTPADSSAEGPEPATGLDTTNPSLRLPIDPAPAVAGVPDAESFHEPESTNEHPVVVPDGQGGPTPSDPTDGMSADEFSAALADLIEPGDLPEGMDDDSFDPDSTFALPAGRVLDVLPPTVTPAGTPDLHETPAAAPPAAPPAAATTGAILESSPSDWPPAPGPEKWAHELEQATEPVAADEPAPHAGLWAPPTLAARSPNDPIGPTVGTMRTGDDLFSRGSGSATGEHPALRLDRSLTPPRGRMRRTMDGVQMFWIDRFRSVGGLIAVLGFVAIALIVGALFLRDLRSTPATTTSSIQVTTTIAPAAPTVLLPTSVLPALNEPASTHATIELRSGQSERVTSTIAPTTTTESTVAPTSTAPATTEAPPAETDEPDEPEVTVGDPDVTEDIAPEGPTRPLIGDVSVSGVTATGAEVRFESDRCVLATFAFGPENGPSQSIDGDARCSSAHTLLLGTVTPALSADTAYIVVITAFDGTQSQRRSIRFVTGQ